MRTTSRNKQRDLKIIILLSTLACVISLIGSLYWSNFSHYNSSAESEGYMRTAEMSDEEIEACKRRVDGDKPSLEPDYSECYEEIVPLNQLSEQQKNESKENAEIIKEARLKRESGECNKIEGMYFQFYPPNMNNVRLYTVEEAKNHCQSLVRYEIKEFQRNQSD